MNQTEQQESQTDLVQRLYGVSASRFDMLLNEFIHELGGFMMKEESELRGALKEECADVKLLAYNVMLNGITNYAVKQYADAIIGQGHSVHAAKEIVMRHFEGCFMAQFIDKRSNHSQVEGVQ